MEKYIQIIRSAPDMVMGEDTNQQRSITSEEFFHHFDCEAKRKR